MACCSQEDLSGQGAGGRGWRLQRRMFEPEIMVALQLLRLTQSNL